MELPVMATVIPTLDGVKAFIPSVGLEQSPWNYFS